MLMIAWWWLLLAIPFAFLAGVIFGAGLMLFDLTGVRDFFHQIATEQPDLNIASRKKQRNSICNQKQANDDDHEQVVYLAAKKASKAT
jgi:hypothetical protein